MFTKLRCFNNQTIINLKKIINKLHVKTKKSKISLFFDIAWCALKYGAGPYDYQEFEFYNLNHKERKTYLTRAKNVKIVRNYNLKDSWYKFDDKVEFNKIFNDYLKRDWLYLNSDNFAEFEDFCKDKKDFIAKPLDGSGGIGIELIKVVGNLKDIFEYLLKNKKFLVEEKIDQNKKIAALNETSVNTLRIITFYDGSDAHIINSVFKIGNGGITDNFSSGSMYTFVEDGKIIVPAIDREDYVYEVHPKSNIKLVGYEIPNYDKAIELVKECAKVVPEVKFVGWDVAILDDGASIIEGNCFPGVYQIKPSFEHKKEGLIPTIEKATGRKI